MPLTQTEYENISTQLFSMVREIEDSQHQQEKLIDSVRVCKDAQTDVNLRALASITYLDKTTTINTLATHFRDTCKKKLDSLNPALPAPTTVGATRAITQVTSPPRPLSPTEEQKLNPKIRQYLEKGYHIKGYTLTP